ncbi:MAG: hypothetical protein HAW63_04460 [Bdellovibrionaceae bacterium]|nr:hypothetical protein [Pseudobdellovibrionaceae bacterium]
MHHNSAITNTFYKFLMLSLLSIFTLNSNISLASVNNCNSKNFLYEVAGGEKNTKENPSAKQLSSVKKNLIKVCNFFKPAKLQIPKKLSILVVKKANTAFFHGLFNILYIPIQFSLKKGTAKHPVHSLPIAVHELGHAYFNSNIYSLTENKTYLSIQSEWKYLSPNAATMERQQRLDYSAPFSGLTELFADCFSAIYFKSPKVITDGLFFTAIKQTHKTAKRRSFLNRNFQHLVGKKVKNTDSHHQFDKARYHLWKYYLSNAKYKNKQKVTKTLLQVFNNFLHQKQSEINFKETDMLIANDLLIAFIDKHFKNLYK